jgi:HSP20 family protein
MSAHHMISISRFQSELNRLFDEALNLAAGQPRAGEWQPPIDVVETPDRVIILVEVPGVRAEDLEVAVQGDTVTLSGRKHPPPSPDGPSRFHRVERLHGRFERRIDLQRPVNSRSATARTESGLLIVELQKVEEKRERRRIVVVEGEGPREDTP